MKGFTLLEVIIVIGIVAILGAAGSGIYTNYNKNVEIKSASQTLIFDLKQAQSKSMTGVGGFKWGVHFVNGATNYYEIFSTPTNYIDGAMVKDTTKYLPGGVVFSDPLASSTKDIIFQKIRGGVDASSTGGAVDFSVSIISQNNSRTINVFSIGTISDNPTCGTYTVTGPDTLTYGTVLGADGKCWLDRNLGATRVATLYNDASSYGHYYQWGRYADGHQITTSGTTTTLSTTNTPGHGNYILSSVSPFDWRNPQNNGLWQGVNGINNPCPTGFRLPTIAEWQNWVVAIGGFTNATCGATSSCRTVAYNSSLKLPSNGYRDKTTGAMGLPGGEGDYWASDLQGLDGYTLWYTATVVYTIYSDSRANGYAVRCIKD